MKTWKSICNIPRICIFCMCCHQHPLLLMGETTIPICHGFPFWKLKWAPLIVWSIFFPQINVTPSLSMNQSIGHLIPSETDSSIFWFWWKKSYPAPLIIIVFFFHCCANFWPIVFENNCVKGSTIIICTKTTIKNTMYKDLVNLRLTLPIKT